jgi:hypothetical protein
MVASNLPDKRLEVTLTLQFPKCQIARDESLHMINEVVVHTLIHTERMVGDESRTKCYPGLLWLCLRYYNNSITYDMKGIEEAA